MFNFSNKTKKDGTDASPISTYAELECAIKRLGNPPPGHIRVFRGQTKDFGKMLASGTRGSRLRSETIFAGCARVLAGRLAGAEAPGNLEVEIFLFWLQAIAQHYGPGSRYLDLTFSLEVALWFALHETQEVEALAVTGPAGPLDLSTDVARKEIWTRYVPLQKGPGYIYVFDVPEWNLKGVPDRGQIIDLAKAPAVFASSKRMQAQQGCLLVSSATVPDMSDLYVAGTPISVNWPMKDAPSVSMATEDMFPTPDVDSWYERFISIPLINRMDDETGMTTLGKPIPVSLYFPENPQKTEEFTKRFITITPPFLHSVVEGELELSTRKVAIRDATVIALEAPLLFATPPVGADEWNLGILTTDISDEVATFTPMGADAGKVPLHNIFFEFSPLDTAGWERVEQPGGEIDWIRAVWLVKEGLDYHLLFCIQSLPKGEIELVGPIPIKHDVHARKFIYESPDSKWKDFFTIPLLAKYLLVTLLILRELSPILKPTPFAAAEMALGGGKRRYLVPLRLDCARLTKSIESRSEKAIYFLRDAHNVQEPFANPSKSNGVLTVESTSPYSALDPVRIRKEARGEAAKPASRA